METAWRSAMALGSNCPPRKLAAIVGVDGAALAAASHVDVRPELFVDIQGGFVVAADENVAAAIDPAPRALVISFRADEGKSPDIVRGPVSRSSTPVVLCGVVERAHENVLARAHVAIRRAALNLFRNCAVAVLVVEPGFFDCASSVESWQKFASSPESGSTPTNDETPSLRALVDGKKFSTDTIVAQGEAEFFAHAGWDSPAKIDAVVEAYQIRERPPLQVLDEEVDISKELAAMGCENEEGSYKTYDGQDVLKIDYQKYSVASDEKQWLNNFRSIIQQHARDNKGKKMPGDSSAGGGGGPFPWCKPSTSVSGKYGSNPIEPGMGAAFFKSMLASKRR